MTGCSIVEETRDTPVRLAIQVRSKPSGAEVYLGPAKAGLPAVADLSPQRLREAGFKRLGVTPVHEKIVLPGQVKVATKYSSGGSRIYESSGLPRVVPTSRSVLAVLPGWEPALVTVHFPKTDSVDIELKPSSRETNRVTGGDAAFSEGRMVVELTSDPEGAEIQVDGEFVGTTPTELRLAPGSYEIRIQGKGGASFHRRLRVLGGGKTRIVADLQP